MDPTTKRSLGTNIALLIGSVLFVFLLVEVFLRICSFCYVYLSEDPRYDLMRSDPISFTALKANYRGVVFNKKGEFNNLLTTNSHGMHDIERALAKPAGCIRIALVGDSFIAGTEVPTKETLTSRIEEALNSDPGNSCIEVLNFGVPGHGTAHQFLSLRSRILRFQPDLVILSFNATDVYDNLYMSQIVRSDSAGIPVDLKPAHKIKSFLRWNSLFYGLLLQRYYMIRTMLASPNGESVGTMGLPEGGYHTEMAEADSFAWQVADKYIGFIDSLCKANDVSFLLTSLPLGNVVDKAEWFEGKQFILDEPERSATRMDEMLTTIGRRRNIPVFPLLPAFRRAKSLHPDVQLYFPYDGHWTSEGHRVAANALSNYLRDRQPSFLRPTANSQ